MSAFFHWLGTPVRALRSLFPFTPEGRQTLIYIMFSCSTGILTLIVWWAMRYLFAHQQWAAGAGLADKVAWALLISVCGYACFVSVRSVKLGKEGFGVEGRDPNQPPSPPGDAEQN